MKARNSRIEWVDVARAMAMFFVIIGHVAPLGNVHTFMYSFHVPAFFFLSGLFSKTEASFLKHIFKRFKNIMVPYYFFGIAAITIYLMLGHLITPDNLLTLKDCIYGLICGSGKTNCLKFNLHLWFLPVLFVMNIFIYPIRRLADKLGEPRKLMCAATVISFVISNLTFSFNPLSFLPLGADTAIRLFPFFVAGNAAGCFNCIMKPRKESTVSAVTYSIASAVLFAATALFAKLNEVITSDKFHVNYFRDYYGNRWLFWCAAVCGVTAIIIVSKLIPPIAPLTFTGRKTLAILVMQKFPIMLFNSVIPITAQLIDNNNIFVIVAVSLVTVVACLAVDAVLSRITPFVYGKPYKQK